MKLTAVQVLKIHYGMEDYTDNDFERKYSHELAAMEEYAAQQLQPPGTSDAEIERKDLLDLAKELRDTLFVRPYNLKEIETKAVTLCDAVFEKEEAQQLQPPGTSDADFCDKFEKFHKWLWDNRWYSFENGKWSRKTTKELYALFLQTKQSGEQREIIK